MDTHAVGEPVKLARARRGCLAWMGWAMVALVLVLLGLAVAGCVYQGVASTRDARNYPAPGRLVDVGGRNLHLNCTGENVEGRPTVILETLSGGLSIYWAWVQPEIAQTTRVCSYDRAGRGWSDLDPEPPTLERTVADLHALLEAAGESGPYVLAGHSIGGIYAHRYAADFPDEVAGIVLVDAAHPEQFDRLPELLEGSRSGARLMSLLAALSQVGVMHAYVDSGGVLDFGGLPDRERAETAAFHASPDHWRSVRAETLAGETIFREAQALGDLGALPLAVVSAGSGMPAGWRALQDELAQLSSNSTHVTVEEAGHSTLAFDKAHAREVSAAILAIVEAAQGE